MYCASYLHDALGSRWPRLDDINAENKEMRKNDEMIAKLVYSVCLSNCLCILEGKSYSVVGGQTRSSVLYSYF